MILKELITRISKVEKILKYARPLSIIGYLIMILKELITRISKVKKILKYARPLKRY